MNNEAKFSLFLLGLAGLAFGIGTCLIIKLGADPVPVLFLGLIIILITGVVFGLFPKLIPGLDFNSSINLRFTGWIGIIFFPSVGLSISPAVGGLEIGLVMGLVAGLAIVGGVCTSAFLKGTAKAIKSIFS